MMTRKDARRIIRGSKAISELARRCEVSRTAVADVIDGKRKSERILAAALALAAEIEPEKQEQAVCA